MSASALGDSAVVGTLLADSVKSTRIDGAGVVFSDSLDNTDTVAPTTGFHGIKSNGGAVALSLPDGITGDVVEFIHTAGGNTIVITPVNLRGAANTITFTATAGGYVKLVFITTTWYIIARSSDAAAAAAAVANLPAVA